MCVILEKLPNKQIPMEHLLAAATRNHDGFGVAVHDGDGLYVRKILEKDPETAANEVQAILQDAEGQKAMVHFRLMTVGDVSSDNLQPIPILRKAEGDDLDLWFFHNGTLQAFKGDPKLSDSVVFSRDVVRPLCIRSAAYNGAENIVRDPFIAELLKKFSGWSRFALFDSWGESLIINKGSGVLTDYGWASNDYSITPPTTYTPSRSYHFTPKVPKTDQKGIISLHDRDRLETKMAENYAVGTDELKPTPSIRTTVQEATGLPLSDFCYLTPSQYLDLVTEHPKLAALLLMDLTYELYEKEVVQTEFENVTREAA